MPFLRLDYKSNESVLKMDVKCDLQRNTLQMKKELLSRIRYSFADVLKDISNIFRMIIFHNNYSRLSLNQEVVSFRAILTLFRFKQCLFRWDQDKKKHVG